MSKKVKKIKIKHLIEHKTKKEVFIKFLVLLLILITYTSYLSYQYGFATGGFLAVISWTFFVLCTPIADAGMLIDFPIRLLFRMRMYITELMVWFIAISINIYGIFFHPEIYEKSFLTTVLYEILKNPIPYWSIILLSFIGTFISVNFADKLMDYIKHKDIKQGLKNQIIFEGIIMIFIFLVIFFVYNIVMDKLGINISNLK